MKKLFIVVSAFLVLTASAAQVADGLVSKLINFSVKELLVEKVFDSFWKDSNEYAMKGSGNEMYRSARRLSYENLGIRYIDQESYIQARTIAVARIKGYFFSGENLKDVYLAIRPRFKEEFSKLSDEEKVGLHQTLADIKTSFELMLKPENQAIYKNWLDQTTGGGPIDGFEMSQIWLENNLSAEDVAKRIKAGELKQLPDKWELEDKAFKKYPDKHIGQFAGRRFKDGGEPLIRRYLEVINLAIADAK